MVDDYGDNRGSGGGGSKLGMELTGVRFRYYKPAEFNALSQAQKTELIKHRSSHDTSNSKKLEGNRGGPPKNKHGAGRVNKSGGGGGSVASKTKNKARQKAASQVAAIAEKVVLRMLGAESTADAVAINRGATKYIMALLKKELAALRT